MSLTPAYLNDPFKLQTLVRAVIAEKIGGPKETCGIGLLMAASASLSPIVYQTIPPVFLIPSTFVLSALGCIILADALFEEWKSHFVLKNTVGIQSSLPPAISEETQRLLFGYSTDTGKPLYLSDDAQTRHCLILGQSGVGKTVAASLLMAQQIQRGGGLLFIDGKLDVDNINSIYQQCVWAGRAQDFYVINPGDPANSNTYNPIADGDPDEVSSRILSMIPSTESNAGSDFYKQSAFEALVVIIGAIQKCGMKYDFYDLAVLMNSAKALEELLEMLRGKYPKSNEFRNFLIFLDRYRIPSNDSRNPLAGQVDIKRLKETLGGIAGRLFTFGTGNFGQILNDYNPDVNLYESITSSKIVYVALPTMGKDIAATNFGKMILGDFKTCISWLQADRAARPKIPHMAFFDEAASYFAESMAVVFEQARSANIFLMPAIQSDSGFSAISPDFSERVISNTTTKFFFRLGTTQSAEMAAELIGMTRVGVASTSESYGASSSAQYVQVSPQKTSSDTESDGVSEKEEEQYLVSPDKLKSMNIGEAVLTFEGNKIYNLVVPLIKLDKQGAANIGPLRLNFRRRTNVPRIKQGLDMMSQAHAYIQTPMSQAKSAVIKAEKDEKKNAGKAHSAPKPVEEAPMGDPLDFTDEF
jgi:intracellular multiplication protein IcmO